MYSSGRRPVAAANRIIGPYTGPAKDVIRDLANTYTVREVMFDPWRAGQLAQELEQERVVVTAFPQTDSRMIPASDRLYRAVVEQRLTVPDTDELRAQLANTIARHNRRGWRLDKPSLDLPNDAVIALCMAIAKPSRTNPNPCRWSHGCSHPLPRLRVPHEGHAVRGV
jgi:phage terminase large subunit-like protein